MPVPRPKLYGDLAPPEFSGMSLTAHGAEPVVSIEDDVVLVPGHRFVSRRSGVLLPQSYDALTGDGISGVLSRPPPLLRAPQEAGELFVVDSFFNHNHGHNLLEAIPRLVLLDRAPAGIEIATSIARSRTIDTLMAGLGVDPDRVRYFREPVFCRRVYLPSPLVRLGQFIHPLAREAFLRLRDLGRLSDIERSERIYVSRLGLHRRRLINESEIEAMFERHGFRVVHPELLPIEAQISLFAGAKMIAGPAGSGLQNTVFSDPEARVLTLSPDDWFKRTDVLISQRDGALGYVFGASEGEERQPGDREWRVDLRTVEDAIAAHFGL